MSATPFLVRCIVAEGPGTALLIAVVIGTGVHTDRLPDGDATRTLLAQLLAGGAGLLALLTVFVLVSGTHLNLAVTPSALLRDGLRGHEVLAYLAAQAVGVALGVAAAHVMFGMPVWAAGAHAATGPALWRSEALAALGLIGASMACGRHALQQSSLVVAAYIAVGYWFTSSSSLANPALALVRALTDGPSGIRPGDVPGYMLAQLVGALLTTPLLNWLMGMDAASAQASGTTIAPAQAVPRHRQASR